MPAQHEAKIRKITELIRNSTSAVVFTGAGISTPSGIPDFRSADTGLWIRNDPMQVASYSAYKYQPDRFYKWLKPLANKILQAQSNPAHIALAEMERNSFIKAVITQNIDELHEKAGSRTVIKLHGSLDLLICIKCDREYKVDGFVHDFLNEGVLPKCNDCGQILKPNIVLYEESLPQLAWNKAEKWCRKTDLMLVVGSSLDVSPANRLPLLALQSGAILVIINFSRTHMDAHAEVCISANAADILPQLSKSLMS